MLDQRRRRWADVVQMLYKYFVFAGLSCRLGCPSVCPHFVPGADLRNPWDFYHIAHTQPLGGADVPFGVMTFYLYFYLHRSAKQLLFKYC